MMHSGPCNVGLQAMESARCAEERWPDNKAFAKLRKKAEQESAKNSGGT